MLRQLWSEERKKRRKTFCNSFFFYLRFEWSSNFFYTRWIPLRGHTHTQQKKSLLQSWLPFFLLGTATGNFTCLIPLSLFFWNGWKFGILNPCARERERERCYVSSVRQSLVYWTALCSPRVLTMEGGKEDGGMVGGAQKRHLLGLPHWEEWITIERHVRSYYIIWKSVSVSFKVFCIQAWISFVVFVWIMMQKKGEKKKDLTHVQCCNDGNGKSFRNTRIDFTQLNAAR